MASKINLSDTKGFHNFALFKRMYEYRYISIKQTGYLIQFSDGKEYIYVPYKILSDTGYFDFAIRN